MKNMIIKNAYIIDGKYNKPFKGDVGIISGKIVLNNIPSNADLIIDASDKYLAPGFIDSHTHGDLIMGQEFATISSVNQGVTTQIAGQCGMSMGPVNPDKIEEIKSFLSVGTAIFPKEMKSWRTWGEYLEYTNNIDKTLNYKLMVGFNTLRIAVMGYDDRDPERHELEAMKELLKEAMEKGAMGLSTGLVYVPGTSANIEELVELAKVIRPYDGIYVTHIRNESHDLIKAVEEAIEIGRRAGVRVNISHHKVMGRGNWGLQKKSLELISEAREEGLSITCDQYPYDRSMTHLHTTIPPWYFSDGVEGMLEEIKRTDIREQIKQEMIRDEGKYENLYVNSGGFKGIMISSSSKTPEAEGLSIDEYSKRLGKDSFDTFFDILIENNGEVGAVYHAMANQDLFDIIKAPFTTVGSDALLRSGGDKSHPRAYGTMPHAICLFNKDNKILELEEIIWKMTGLPAEIYGLKSKGIIEDGYDADLVIFDYDKIRDGATYSNPTEVSEGIEYVIVKGEIVWKDKLLTGATPGEIILHTNSRL
ncbi:MAG: D-aminoacylase [Tissierellia bacterium]|nr:D-aminoacylase [Tissierellia bacterium]